MLILSKFLTQQRIKAALHLKWTCLTTNSIKNFHDLNGNARYLQPMSAEPNPCRGFKSCSLLFSEESSVVEGNDQVEETGKNKRYLNPRKDRSKVIPVETSIRYMKSIAYKTTYGDEAVWVKYRRNFKGQFIPKKTRESCIIAGRIQTGSPCPVCRDEYLVLDYRNVDLLKQFINPYTGKVYDSRVIHLCRKKLFQLDVELRKAKLLGLITYQVPFREFDYNDYYPDYQS